MATKFDKVRDEYLTKVKELFEASRYEVLRTGSQELCLPIVGEEDEEGYLVISFKVPKGSRDGDLYDGYAAAEEYEMKCKAKEEKAREAEKKKAEKIERDRKIREEKKKARVERENVG